MTSRNTIACLLVSVGLLTPISALGGRGPVEEPAIRRVGSRLEVVVAGNLSLEASLLNRAELSTLASGAEEVLPRLEADLGLRLTRPFRIYLLPPAGRQSREEKLIDSLAPPWAAGYVLGGERLGAVRLDLVDRYPYRDALSVLTHELTHVLLDDGVGDGLPTWFEEGVATWLGRRWGLRDTLVLSSNLLVGELPSLDRLNGFFRSSSGRARIAYAASFDFVQWTVDRYGEEVVAQIIELASRRSFEEAWEGTTGESLASSEARWRQGSVLLYRWVPLLTGSGTLWLAITLLALLAGARRRGRTRRLHERWEAEEGGSDEGGSRAGEANDGPPGGWVH